MQQQYKVNNTVFDNIEDATAHVSTLNKAVTISPYTAPTEASIKLNVVRNMLVREMLEWAGSFVQHMSPSTDVDWMYSFEDDEGNNDAGDCYYECGTNVTFGTNQVWQDDMHDYTSAVDNFESLLGNYNEYDTVEKLSEMLNTMYHTMSDHSSETDSYIGEIRHSVKQMCDSSDNIAHSYNEPTRTTTISFVAPRNIDSMYADYIAKRNS
jgi:hypothetical protein|tara:strand:- start:38 stop:667 length:630 start_codon:yes stop_codon:yes gene_type:complete